ncbi:hypothetical protein SAMN04488168_12338 [Bacillus sp. 491mf]|uniref:VirB4 family type IV secretion system protein n=1 Tax=Bacillus sp. 491mf TaxID=1761755 RepID=UPI0008E5BF9E|nr:hypothetical protein [Bacillus sp. 491mf]SFD18429.1 hypothetical protein SAMN04488168_12338 [Bacillus sp. 491mf]
MLRLLGKRKEKVTQEIFEEKELITFKDLLAPDVIEEKEEYVQLGGNYTKTIGIYDYPKHVFGNWLSQLRRFKGNLSISVHIERKPSEDMLKHLNSAIPELGSREVNADQRTKRESKLEKKNAELLLDKLIESDRDEVFAVHMYLHIQAQSMKQLDKLNEQVMRVVRRAKLKGTEIRHRSLEAFHSTLPIRQNQVPEVTRRDMDAEALSSLFPFDDSEIFMQSETAIIKGINITTGSLVIVDHFKLLNHNEFIAGFSGTGKTTTLVSDILRHWIMGIINYIIDPEGELTPIVKKLGGTVIKLSNMSKTVINPLEILNAEITDTEGFDDEGEVETFMASLLAQKIQRLKLLFRTVKKGLSQVEEALIEKILLKTYENCSANITHETDFRNLKSTDFPTFTDMMKEIEGLPSEEAHILRDFKLIFETYVTGSNSNLFNGHTNVDLTNDLISFDLKHLEDGSDLKRTAMYNVITFLWDEITRDKTRLKRLTIDECHVVADPDEPLLMKFIYQIYKRIRKYKGGATVATQQIEDYLSASDGKRNYGAAIIENSYTKFILGLEERGLQDLVTKGGIQLSAKELDILRRKIRCKGIYCIGTKRVHMEVVQTQEEVRLFDASRYEKTFGRNAKEIPVYDIQELKRGVS